LVYCPLHHCGWSQFGIFLHERIQTIDSGRLGQTAIICRHCHSNFKSMLEKFWIPHLLLYRFRSLLLPHYLSPSSFSQRISYYFIGDPDWFRLDTHLQLRQIVWHLSSSRYIFY